MAVELEPGHRRDGPRGSAERAAERLGIAPLTVVASLAFVAAVAAGGAFSALVNYDLVGFGHLPRAAVFCCLILIAVNAVLSRLRAKRLFSTAQLAFVYIAVLVMAGFPGQQLVTYLYLGMIGSQYYSLASGNEYATEVLPHLKSWMVPDLDPESPAISWAFHGLPYHASVPWQPWVTPLLAWTPLVFALLLLQVSVASLLRKRWDEERLTYPLAQAPVEFIRYASGRAAVPELMRSKLFWAMFLIPVVVHTKNAFHFQNPYIGEWNLQKNIGVIFGQPPWSYFDNLPLFVYFECMGATYMIPVATGFSLWFFWLLRRFIYVYRTQRGLINHDAYLKYQGLGAYTFLAGLCVWGARHTLRQAVSETLSRDARRDDSAEPMPPRLAVWGVLVSFVVIVGWGMAAGGSPLATFLLALFYVIALIVLSRLVAESGLYAIWTPFDPPQEVVAKLWPQKAGLPNAIVTPLCYMGWKTQDLASATMANVMQGYKVGELVGLRPRSVLWVMAASLFVAYFASHPSSLYALYSNGVYGLGWWPRGAAESVPRQIHDYTAARTAFTWSEGYVGMVHGAIIVGGLYLLRTFYHQLPFQPFAYAAALGPQFMMDRYGFSIFCGWLVKYLVLKYGGVGTHNKVRPAALGLIAGNSFILLFWTIVHYFRPIEGVLVIE